MSKRRFPSEVMLPLALALVRELGPLCSRIALAGSLRRGALSVGDIEIVCCPADEGLEGWFADGLRTGQIEKRSKADGSVLSWGSRFKALVHWPSGGIPVDVFMVLPDRQWGPTYLIRTGPGSANRALVTPVGRRYQEEDGVWREGVMPEGLAHREGALLRVATGEALDTPEEADVFAALKMPYVPPTLRGYATYQALRQGKPIPTFSPQWSQGDDYFVNGHRFVMEVETAAAVVQPLEQGRLL